MSVFYLSSFLVGEDHVIQILFFTLLSFKKKHVPEFSYKMLVNTKAHVRISHAVLRFQSSYFSSCSFLDTHLHLCIS
jgi:hypothetical protein